MSESPKTNHPELWKFVDAFLWHEWDPIGMKSLEGPRDEYWSYVDPVCERLLSRCSEAEIVEYLMFIETEWMRLTRDDAKLRARTQDLVARLCKLSSIFV